MNYSTLEFQIEGEGGINGEAGKNIAIRNFIERNHQTILWKHQQQKEHTEYKGLDCMFVSCHLRVFRVNPHSIVAWMSRKSMLETAVKSETGVKSG